MSAVDLATYIRARLHELKKTTTAAAKQSGISRQTWHKLLRADISEARISTLTAVANTLDTHVLSMLRIYFNGQELPVDSSLAEETKAFASGFIADITHPDGSEVKAGETFEKVWEVANLGTEAWIGWKLTCIDDELRAEKPDRKDLEYSLTPQTTEISIPDTHPGEHVRLHVTLTAPDHACTAVSYWKSVNADGEVVFPNLSGLYCLVNVSTG